jgi:hypothetical protein
MRVSHIFEGAEILDNKEWQIIIIREVQKELECLYNNIS